MSSRCLMDYSTRERIIVLRGLPGSGKSEWAKEVVKDDDRFARVCRDDIRLMLSNTLHEGTLSEDLVTEVETAAVLAILKVGRVPIVDAMHLYQRWINRWQKLGYELEVIEFPEQLETLLSRNLARGETVPSAVIEKLFKNNARPDTGDLKPIHLSPEAHVVSRFEKYVPTGILQEAVIVDIDGTLAHMDGRSPYDYSKVHTDTVDHAVREVVSALEEDKFIIIVSGRKGDCRKATEDWLARNAIRYDKLYMRDEKDQRPDTIVKYEILCDQIAPRYDVLAAIDDRPSVCRMWRAIGIKTFQVGDPHHEF